MKENMKFVNEIGKYSQASRGTNRFSSQASPVASPLSDTRANVMIKAPMNPKIFKDAVYQKLKSYPANRIHDQGQLNLNRGTS